ANTVYHLYGCGTDGGCGPCYNGHSDGFELGMLDSVELVGNLVYDVRSTSAVILDNWQGDSANVHNLLLANNLFYTPECGVVVYLFYVDGVRMYNNTIWKSNWLGVSVGPRVTRVEAYNNIVQCIDYTFLGGVYSASDHKYDYNLVGFSNRGLAAQAHDVVSADPKFRKIPIASDNTTAHVYRTVTPADFELMPGSQAIGAGTSGAGVPSTDFYGRGRIVPYDMGAIKYVNTGVGQASGSTRSPGNGARLPSVVYVKDAAALGALGSVDTYDLFGRKTDGPKNGSGCLFVKRQDGGVRRIVVVR
ncbi:MAG: choice-of-anchor Q domain-containing protein, partial [Terracidiphilus sp.]